MENYRGMMLTEGKLLIRPSEISRNPTSSHLVASRRNGRRERWILPCEVFLFLLANDVSVCRKSLQHGASGFTSAPKEGVLLKSIALKNPSPWPGLNPQNLRPMASTLTTRPRGRLITELLGWVINYVCGQHWRHYVIHGTDKRR
jgi:hypothetical protein